MDNSFLVVFIRVDGQEDGVGVSVRERYPAGDNNVGDVTVAPLVNVSKYYSPGVTFCFFNLISIF
jgi:hypothetical protein